MNHLLVFVFVSVIYSVAGQYQNAALQRCVEVANTTSKLNPMAKCAYVQDSVMCGIKALDLAESDATAQEIESGRQWANKTLKDYGCTGNFDTILQQVKQNPELLEVLGCMEDAIEKDFQETDKTKRCDIIEEGIKCGIRAMNFHEGTPSQTDLMFGQDFSGRYLTIYGCTYFDSLIRQVKNSGPTVFPIGWLTAVMAAFILMFTAV